MLWQNGSTVAVLEFINFIRQVNGVNYTSENDIYYDKTLTTELWFATGHDEVHGAIYEPTGTDYNKEFENFLYVLGEACIMGDIYSLD